MNKKKNNNIVNPLSPDVQRALGRVLAGIAAYNRVLLTTEDIKFFENVFWRDRVVALVFQSNLRNQETIDAPAKAWSQYCNYIVACEKYIRDYRTPKNARILLQDVSEGFRAFLDCKGALGFLAMRRPYIERWFERVK